MSVIETCRRLDVPVRNYLRDVPPGMGDVSVSKLGQRTPAEWNRAPPEDSSVKHRVL